MASDKQVAFIQKLLKERDTAGALNTLEADLSSTETNIRLLDIPVASTLIGRLLACPMKADKPAELTPGVYETTDGVFVVKPNREKTRLYAKRLVEINSTRLNVEGEVIEIEFEYAPGAIYRITADDKMSIEKARALTIRYGRCIVCGRRLKVASSVERGIGPVCAQYFAA